MQDKNEPAGTIDHFCSDPRLIFEKSRKNTFKKCPHLPDALARSTLAIPELSEPEVIRHYTALSKLNFGMDTGMYPLGSCISDFAVLNSNYMVSKHDVTALDYDEKFYFSSILRIST